MPQDAELTLAESPRAAAEARRWVSEVCRGLGREDLTECAELGVSELVANALIHAEPPYRIRVRGTASHPRIEVVDASTLPPIPPAAREAADSPEPDLDDLDLLLTFGRGLAMVGQCSVAWGATIEPDGKIVWFEPAAEMTDVETPDWVVDHQEPTRPVTSQDGVVTARLLDFDVPLYVSLARQYRELRRELRLLALSHESDYPLAGDLSEMFTTFERQFPLSFQDQLESAIAAGVTTADLTFATTPEAAPIFVTMAEMFDVADAFCRAERLLSLARTPAQRDFQNWLLGELVAQSEGAGPTRWRGTSSAHAPSASQVG